MARSEWVRWGSLAALGAGALAILYFLLSLAVGKGDQPGPLDILDILAMVLEVIALLGFHALQGRNYGRIGRAGLYITIGTKVVFEFLILAYLFLAMWALSGLCPWGCWVRWSGWYFMVRLLCKRGCSHAGAGYCSSYLCLLAYY